MQATCTKLRDGSWGLRIQGRAVKDQTVTVCTRSGVTTQKTVGAILWTGNGITLATIAGEHTTKRTRGDCSCSASCCARRCQCEPHCNCRGGNVYDC